MPGIVEVGQHIPVGTAIENLVFLAATAVAEDFEGRIFYLPL